MDTASLDQKFNLLFRSKVSTSAFRCSAHNIVFVLLVDANQIPKLSIWQMVNAETCRMWERSLSLDVVAEHFKTGGMDFDHSAEGFEEIGDIFRKGYQISNLSNILVDPTTNALSFKLSYVAGYTGEFKLSDHKDIGIEAWTTILALTQMLEASPNPLKRSLES